MKFLNKKEQVIDIELTSYGKHLLSKGQMRPVYYAFFDDDVLYDSEYGGVSEEQNNSQDRIKETPRIESQHSWCGVETKVLQNNRFIRMGERDEETGKYKRLGAKQVQPTPEKHYALSAPLGTMSLDAENSPAWAINILQGELSGAVEYKTGNHPTVRVPQLNMESVTYKTKVEIDDSFSGSLDLEVPDDLTDSALDVGSLVSKFDDGSFVRVTEDSIVLEIDENNTLFENENFDVEIYEISEDTESNQEVLTPLFFRKPKPQVINGILLDDEDRNIEPIELDPSYVEYFFDILVDDEIDIELLCSLKPVDRAEGLFNQRQLDCPEGEEANPITLYDTDVTEEDLEDDC